MEVNMYSISLLPYEYKIHNLKAKKKNIGLLLATGIMGVLFLAYTILSVYASGKTAELNGIRAEYAAVEAQIEKMGDIKIFYDEVGVLSKEVTAAAGSNPDWSLLISSIGNSVPESVILRSMKFNYQGSSGECVILGTGKDHGAVSGWLKKLGDTEGIGEINCKFSSLSGNYDSVEFELSFLILQGPGYKIPLEVR